MMKYTDKELNELMDVVFRKGVTESEMGCVLDWKKWRVEYTKTKSGSEDIVEYEVREIIAIRNEYRVVDMLKYLLSFGHCDKLKRYDLKWSGGWYLDGGLIKFAPTFKTEELEDAFEYMDKQIKLAKETKSTSKILSIKPN